MVMLSIPPASSANFSSTSAALAGSWNAAGSASAARPDASG
jgi:hypothetical protein